MCEDYRAGATFDLDADRADEAAGRTIGCPALVLASSAYLERPGEPSPLGVWRQGFAPEAQGKVVDAGHFLAEENPGATLAALTDFL